MALQVNKGIIACGDDEHLQKIQANVPVFFMVLVKKMIFKQEILLKQRKVQHLMYLFAIRFMIHSRFRAYGDHNILNSLAVIALCHYEEN